MTTTRPPFALTATLLASFLAICAVNIFGAIFLDPPITQYANGLINALAASLLFATWWFYTSPSREAAFAVTVILHISTITTVCVAGVIGVTGTARYPATTITGFLIVALGMAFVAYTVSRTVNDPRTTISRRDTDVSTASLMTVAELDALVADVCDLIADRHPCLDITGDREAFTPTIAFLDTLDHVRRRNPSAGPVYRCPSERGHCDGHGDGQATTDAPANSAASGVDRR